MSLQSTLNNMKKMLEDSISNNGLKGKESLIRSQVLINQLHEAVKQDLVAHGISASRIYPPVNNTKPELKIAGFLKKKDQDICVIPVDIKPQKRVINWGPLQFENEYDEYGESFTERTIIINVRSQMSSIAKNTDTLFERTFAEALNLHTIYPSVVLGEVYLIPVYEYDDSVMDQRRIEFKSNRTNLEKYISFFTALNNRQSDSEDLHMYERCALVIADFSKSPCKIYSSTDELKKDKLVSSNFSLELRDISFEGFTRDILSAYNSRF